MLARLGKSRLSVRRHARKGLAGKRSRRGITLDRPCRTDEPAQFGRQGRYKSAEPEPSDGSQNTVKVGGELGRILGTKR